MFIVALWSPVGKGVASRLSCVRHFLVLLSLSHMASWVRCVTRLYRFLIFVFSLTFFDTKREEVCFSLLHFAASLYLYIISIGFFKVPCGKMGK